MTSKNKKDPLEWWFCVKIYIESNSSQLSIFYTRKSDYNCFPVLHDALEKKMELIGFEYDAIYLYVVKANFCWFLFKMWKTNDHFHDQMMCGHARTFHSTNFFSTKFRSKVQLIFRWLHFANRQFNLKLSQASCRWGFFFFVWSFCPSSKSNLGQLDLLAISKCFECDSVGKRQLAKCKSAANG